MTWPTAQAKTNFDQSSDDPKVARSDLATNVDKFNQMRSHVSSYVQGLLDDADDAAARTTLGLGTAAVKNTGTSGDALGLLNALANWSDAFLLSGAISPSQITVNQNNYNPTGLSGATQIFVDSDASRNVTGIVPGASADGRLLLFTNDGSFDIVLVNQSASSDAANRFLFAGGDRTLTPDESVLMRYDGTSSRWRAAHDVIVSAGGLLDVQIFTASGDWTPNANAVSALIFCTGGGGGGGTAGPNESDAGGGAGATAIDFIADTTGISSETVTIGAGGVAETTGGTTSVAALAVAEGGVGVSGQSGGDGGSATAGTLQIDGGGGGAGHAADQRSGHGGASFWGGGGAGRIIDGAGKAGEAYGSGGAGGTNTGSGQEAGGAGKVGVVMVLEW